MRIITYFGAVRCVVCRNKKAVSWSDRTCFFNTESPFYQGVTRLQDPFIALEWDSFHEIRYQDKPLKFSKLVGVGAISDFVCQESDSKRHLKDWFSDQNDLILGYFSYEFKNSLENLTSENSDVIGFPNFHFFVPKDAYLLTQGGWLKLSLQSSANEVQKADSILPSIGEEIYVEPEEDYIHKVENLKQHIQFGDVYEVNYCVQHGFENTVVNPYKLYHELQTNSPAPFSCFVADNGKYLMSSSPERFMRKEGARVISQPMKGTNRRSDNNETQKNALRNNAKEVAENVMITDLVRNDLSRSSKKGTVQVEELCGIYEFEHVNQMISTVSAELRDDVHPLDALLNAFPMGSMTGAPKIRAMKLIDQYEEFSRGLYSGSVGYFTPDLDFDFNVVIRSILYNEEKQVVTFPTGGAITIHSDPEKEYEECMLKAEAMRNVLLNHAK